MSRPLVTPLLASADRDVHTRPFYLFTSKVKGKVVGSGEGIRAVYTGTVLGSGCNDPRVTHRSFEPSLNQVSKTDVGVMRVVSGTLSSWSQWTLFTSKTPVGLGGFVFDGTLF